MPSTVISEIKYDSESGALKIAYVSGQVYEYQNVPETVYKDLKASRSKGRYFRFFIKNIYPFEKLEK